MQVSGCGPILLEPRDPGHSGFPSSGQLQEHGLDPETDVHRPTAEQRWAVIDGSRPAGERLLSPAVTRDEAQALLDALPHDQRTGWTFTGTVERFHAAQRDEEPDAPGIDI